MFIYLFSFTNRILRFVLPFIFQKLINYLLMPSLAELLESHFQEKKHQTQDVASATVLYRNEW